jgi:hypothetical protein
MPDEEDDDMKRQQSAGQKKSGDAGGKASSPGAHAAPPAAEQSTPQASAPRPDASSTSPPSKPPATAPSPAASTEASPTEKPVIMGAAPPTAEYVVTVDTRTGVAVKIEKLSPEGQRTELTKEEYARLGLQGASIQSASTTGEYDATNASAFEAYYRGIADYLSLMSGIH